MSGFKPCTHLRLKAPSTFSAPLCSQADAPAGPPAAAVGAASSSISGTWGAGCARSTAPPVSKVLKPLSARANRLFIHGESDSGSWANVRGHTCTVRFKGCEIALQRLQLQAAQQTDGVTGPD